VNCRVQDLPQIISIQKRSPGGAVAYAGLFCDPWECAHAFERDVRQMLLLLNRITALHNM